MKTKKRLRFSVAMLLSVLMVVAAVGGFGVLLSNGTVYAANTPFDTTKAVSVNGAAVTPGADSSGTVTHKGLLVSPEDPKGEYSGKINAVLPANSTIQYSFPGTLYSDGNHYCKRIDFTFRFTSASNPDDWFEIIYYNVDWNGWYNSMAVRDSEGHFRTANNKNEYFDVAGIYPHFPYYGSNDSYSGFIKTILTESGTLAIYIPMRADTEAWTCCLAKFDSDEYTDIDNTNGICGLKKIDFSAGYTVSFSAKSKSGEDTAPLLIEKINGQSFETATFETEPLWYSAYADTVKIELSNEIAAEYTDIDPLIIPSATYTYPLRGTEAADIAKIELQKDGGEWMPVSAGDKVAAAGSYRIRYTAVAGGTSAGNVLEKTFLVCKDYFDMSGFVDVTGGIVTPGADRSGEVIHKGLLIEAETKKGEYSGVINGVFKGNAKIDFNFPGILNDNGSAPSIDFTFRFTDVNDPENYFDVILFNDGWAGWYTAMAVRDKDGNIRTTRYGSTLTIFDKKTSGDDNDALNNLPYSGGNGKKAGYLDLQWNGDVLEIYVLSAGGKRYCLAKFDSDAYGAFDQANMVYGLKKIAFPDGYTVSFTAKSKGDKATSPLLIEEINGISLAGKWFGAAYMTYKNMEYESGAADVRLEATKDPLTPDALGLGVRFHYTVKLGTLTLKAQETVFPEETIDLLRENTVNVTYSFLSKTVHRQVTVVNTPPILALNGVSDEAGYRKGGASESQLSLLKSDITAIDLLDGAIGADAISLYMRKPGQADFTPIAEQTFRPDVLGTYEIKYVATDSAGKTAEIVRKIRVVDGELPVITVNGKMPETSTVGAVLTLPTATATDRGEPLSSLTVNVFRGGNRVEIVNGKITLSQAGVYTVVYYAVDSDGNESMVEYEINVPEDVDKPIIAEATIPELVKLGTEISLPQMSATDTTDGTVEVRVFVTYGNEEIPLTNRTFTASKEGVYSVVCLATDKAGNTAERVYEITVLQNIPDPIDPGQPGKDEGPGKLDKGIAIYIAVGVAVVIAAGAVIILVVKKRRK